MPNDQQSTLVKVIFSYQSVIDIDFAFCTNESRGTTKLEYHNKNIELATAAVATTTAASTAAELVIHEREKKKSS